ncbi:hypothetical protein BDV96DRAFT_573612 [Lophiotrema nucula]|uniref:Uncharacterized protein n=1 Tax=Lophiotrema nucula TaxID=690887 RepID=A0A6A5Z9M2_9PLEO|nr:hypothetical protein BDV96DRAFT_573612 [Lophiotrema nucula]
MLRLKPSEITLTPADVEETRRRMARRQAAQALPNTRSARSSRLGQLPHDSVPRLLRGPERLRDAATTRLGNIPLLEPHAAVHSSAEDADGDDEQEHQDESFKPQSETDHKYETISSPTHFSPSARDEPSATEALITPTRRTQLPFRLAQSSGRATSRLSSRENTEDDTPPSPPKHRFGLPVFGRARTNTSEEISEEVDSELYASTDGLADTTPIALPRLDDVPGAGRLRSLRQHSSHAPSPLRQGHVVSSPRRPELDDMTDAHGSSQPEILPTTYLEGYFASPGSYVFEEHRRLPHTEPRRHSRHPVRNLEDHSFNNGHSQARTGYDPQLDGQSSAEHDFWTGPSAEPDYGREDATHSRNDRDNTASQARALTRSRSTLESTSESFRELHLRHFASPGDGIQYRKNGSSGSDLPRHGSQRFSEVSSSSSQPYSFYELPGSRHSSNSHYTDPLSQSQYDGAGSSRHLSRGAYFSIRPSQVRATVDGPLRPPPVRVSSFSSPNLTAALQLGISPLPARPYTRASSSQSTPRPSTGIVTPSDFVGESQDAAIAAERDLPSPLDLLEQRAASYLSRIQAATQAEAIEPTHRRRNVDNSGSHERSSGSGSIRQMSGNSATARPRPSRRDLHARSAQRSSENAPVIASANETRRDVRIGRAQLHRVTMGQIQHGPPPQGVRLRGGEASHDAASVRTNAQHASSPMDRTRRAPPSPVAGLSASCPPGDATASEGEHRSSPMSSNQRRQQRYQVYDTASMMARVSPNAAMGDILQPEVDTQRRSLMQSLGTRARRERRAPPQSTVLRQEEQVSLPIDHQHAANRRPPMIRAGTSRRRMSPRLENQENSGEAEVGLMREELMTVGMRYEDAQQLDVMDETPPRVGRFERHILGD